MFLLVFVSTNPPPKERKRNNRGIREQSDERRREIKIITYQPAQSTKKTIHSP